MFAKVFSQIFESSIAEDYRVRLVFEDFLKLSDKDGIVDMTPESIARRTNVPLDIVRHGIEQLELPDPSSRSPEHQGKRLLRLDTHRNWGWRIVNFEKYRLSASKEMLRMAEADRKAAWRKSKGFPAPLPKLKEIKAETEADKSRTCPGQSRTCPGQSRTFPSSDVEAKAHAALAGVPEQFALDTWNKAMSRGERDAKGLIISSFRHYLATEWKYERERIEKGKFNGTNAKSQSINPAADRRNAGTIGGTDYGAAGKRQLERQRAAAEARKVGNGAVEHEPPPPAA